MGLEPTTPCLQSRCSSQLSYVPLRSSMPRSREEPGGELDVNDVGGASVAPRRA
jgi:hypothetical protein